MMMYLNITHTIDGDVTFFKGTRDGYLNGESSENTREQGEAHICMRETSILPILTGLYSFLYVFK